MPSSISIGIASLFAIILAITTWRLARRDTAQSTAEDFTSNRKLNLGVLLIAGAPIGIIVDTFATMYPDSTVLSPSQHTLTALPIVSVQLAWMAAVGLLSTYTTLHLISAYVQYQRYPPIDSPGRGLAWWQRYRRWKYVIRTHHKSMIFATTALLLIAVFGTQLGFGLIIPLGITIYAILLTFVSLHGRGRADYEEEQRLFHSTTTDPRTAPGDD